MPRFFFDTHDGPQHFRDAEGLEFVSPEAARWAAMQAVSEMAKDRLPEGHRRDFVTHVRDESGRVIYIATMSLTGRWLN